MLRSKPTFVGNHVHKLLKVNTLMTLEIHNPFFIGLKLKNIRIIGDTINEAIREHCCQYSDLHNDAEAMVKTFTTLLKLFRKCHRGYNSAV